MESTTRSHKLLQEAARFVPGGVNSAKRNTHPILCIRRAAGAYLEDVDGRRLIDYHAAYGPIILGHSYPVVVEQVCKTVQDHVLFGLGTTELEVALAEKIVLHVPSVEQVLLCNSGSEATYHAIRLARAVTGREKIVKFQGCYNGFHDYVLRNIWSSPERIGKRDPRSAGMLEAAIDSTLVCRFNDLADIERVLQANQGEVAAIILAPVAHEAASILPGAGFLDGVRQLCDRSGALLIFDEMVTGFRHHIGGYQAIADVKPDLTTLGKAMANGFPIAAVGGRRELMERFDCHPEGDVYFGGTYCGNAVGVAAALATIGVLETEPVYEHIFGLGERMRHGLREVIDAEGASAIVVGFGSLFQLAFMEGQLESYDDAVRNDTGVASRYRGELVARGVVMSPVNVGRNHISYSHTVADIDRALEAAGPAIRAALSTPACSPVE